MRSYVGEIKVTGIDEQNMFELKQRKHFWQPAL